MPSGAETVRSACRDAMTYQAPTPMPVNSAMKPTVNNAVARNVAAGGRGDVRHQFARWPTSLPLLSLPVKLRWLGVAKRPSRVYGRTARMVKLS